MAVAVQNGQSVIVITATRGEKGIQDESRWPAERLGQIRADEMAEALRRLGVNKNHWLDLPDGDCAHCDQTEAVGRIAKLISEHQPDTILTFGPDGLTGHDDHKTVSKWAALARYQAASAAKIYHAVQTTQEYEAMREADEQLDIFFNIDKPPLYDKAECDICFCMDDDVFDKKFSALRAMPSQTETLLNNYGDKMCESLSVEAFVRAE